MLPAFVAEPSEWPVSVAAANHPDFRESFRYFGIPSTHGSRLERMLPSKASLGDWVIRIHRINSTDTHRRFVYTLQNVTNKEYLTFSTAQNEPDREKRNDVCTCLLPLCAVGRRGSGAIHVVSLSPSVYLDIGPARLTTDGTYRVYRGWDIFTYQNPMRKLIVDGGNLRLVPVTKFTQSSLGIGDDGLVDTFWEILRFSAQTQNHRPHFWLPWFFSPFPADAERADAVALGPYEGNLNPQSKITENTAVQVYKDAVLKYGPDSLLCANVLRHISRKMIVVCSKQKGIVF